MSRILLEATNIEVNYGEQAVLRIDRLAIRDGDRIGLIGENGAGKSTLLAVLAGDRAPDSGTVRRTCAVAQIRQGGDSDAAIAGQWRSEFLAPESRDGLSGGEQTRRRIAGALSAAAPLLLADEPTSDLDGPGIARLRERLAGYAGALLLVSHDRDLLNALCNRIWHLENGAIADFPGSYDAYRAELKRRREFQQFEYDQYRAERARLKAAAQRQAEWTASVKKAPKRMGNSEARLHTHEYTDSMLALSHAKQKLQRRMERLEKKERPRDLPDIRMGLGVSHPIGSKVALDARIRSLHAGGRMLLCDARLTLPTGSRTALLGPNGCGKTTLLRALRGEGGALDGEVRFNPGARVGWFDQDHARALDFAETALHNAMVDASAPESDCRTVLARLNLRGDDVFKPVGVLSGGERAKVALARLLLSDRNLLVLDEPTNHLDVFTLEALEKLLASYGGTLLFVSHDRAFVGAVATRIAQFAGTSLETFDGALSEMETAQKQDRSAEARRLAITALEMRMAALAGRMAQPKKGDRPEQLREEYDRLTAELRALKRGE